jgi:phospholipid/cholesterol/gamma-HCH transport system ATP-binding protein
MDKLKARGVASIFVTHDIPAALKVSDRILILKNGVIAYQGTPREIVNTDNPIVKDFFIDMAKKV